VSRIGEQGGDDMSAKRLLLLAILVGIATGVAFTQPLRLRLNNNADWDLTFDVTDLTGAAGSDFASDIESADGHQQIRIQNASGNWEITVSRADTVWHSGIQIYVKRTSDGTGGTTISGGTTYQEITTTDRLFFSGSGNPRDINLRFQTNGAFASQGVPVNTYSTTVTYTITDNL
jgi:hypothetical protein